MRFRICIYYFSHTSYFPSLVRALYAEHNLGIYTCCLKVGRRDNFKCVAVCLMWTKPSGIWMQAKIWASHLVKSNQQSKSHGYEPGTSIRCFMIRGETLFTIPKIPCELAIDLTSGHSKSFTTFVRRSIITRAHNVKWPHQIISWCTYYCHTKSRQWSTLPLSFTHHPNDSPRCESRSAAVFILMAYIGRRLWSFRCSLTQFRRSCKLWTREYDAQTISISAQVP